MIYPIVKLLDPVLETPAQTVTVFNAELKQLVADMFESMYAAQGVGLAAPQIGISKRVAVVDVTFKDLVKNREVWKDPEITKYANYYVQPVPGDSARTELQGRQQAISKLADEILSRTVEGW